ncbi:MAG: thioredoxin [Planctomycetota bacterium]|nr:thioredoxin [Planctomycetota bacterium]
MTKTLTITNENFNNEILANEGPVLLDFSAEWCGPCQVLSPIIDELAEENAQIAIVGKLNIDTDPALAAAYGVQSVPTVLLFRSGEVIQRFVGLQPKRVFQAAILSAA